MKNRIIFILLFLGFGSLGHAQSLDHYLKVAAENNPGLQAFYTEYLAAKQKIPQVGTLPDPELGLGLFLPPMEHISGKEHVSFQIMQMFPWFGTLKSQEDVASKIALTRLEVFYDAMNSLFYQVKNSWYELYRLEQEISTTKDNLDILKDFERLALTRFQVGGSDAQRSSKAGMSDVLRIRMELKELENQLVLLENSRKPIQVQFNKLLNRDISDTIVLADTLAMEELNVHRLLLLDSITQNNPALKILEAEHEAYESQKELVRLQGRPTFGVGLQYTLMSPRMDGGMSHGGHNMVMPMVNVTIPIYRKKYEAMEQEIELNQHAVRQRKESTVNSLTTEWSSIQRDLDDAIRKANLYAGQIDLAKQILDLLMTEYATDGQDFEEVLRTQQQLLDYQLQLIHATVDQFNSVAYLENLAATELH